MSRLPPQNGSHYVAHGQTDMQVSSCLIFSTIGRCQVKPLTLLTV